MFKINCEKGCQTPVYKGNDVEGLCQRIHAYIKKLSFPFDLDVSIGCAPYHKDIHKWNDWFIEADKQLYNPVFDS